jgi:hypothetical protein
LPLAQSAPVDAPVNAVLVPAPAAAALLAVSLRTFESLVTSGVIDPVAADPATGAPLFSHDQVILLATLRQAQRTVAELADAYAAVRAQAAPARQTGGDA